VLVNPNIYKAFHSGASRFSISIKIFMYTDLLILYHIILTHVKENDSVKSYLPDYRFTIHLVFFLYIVKEGDEMKTKLYRNADVIAGITLKDAAAPEMGNMALHVCQDPHAIVENRQKLALSIGTDLQSFVCAHQTHSANFHYVTIADKGKGAIVQDTAIPDTDALYTFEPDIVLCSFTADCVPVFFHDDVKGLVGVIHSGWQGTVKEITPAVMKHVIETEGCDPEHIHVHLGPALSQKRFEVDEDVFLQYENLGYAEEFMYFEPTTGKYHIDNQLSVKRQCELAGIPSNQISIDRTCTFDSPEGFSYRQDKQCGRHLSFIMKKSH